jgi:hypothetical protein
VVMGLHAQELEKDRRDTRGELTGDYEIRAVQYTL